jgi:hypothetical protein
VVDFIQNLTKEFPKVKLIRKQDSWLMKIISKILFFNKTFMKDYTTTIGNRIYIPDGWDNWTHTDIILRHELIHLRQQKRYGFLLYCFLYLFIFFPIGLAYFRMKFEKEAYEESIKAFIEIYGKQCTLKFKEEFVKNFVGSAYGWMWPFRESIENWFDDSVERFSNGN